MDGGSTVSAHSPVRHPSKLTEILQYALARTPPVLHIIRERDVGLFSLIQQVIANVPWALREGRIPIADFGQRTAYWMPGGRYDRDSVWEYYFEPIVKAFPASSIPGQLRERIEQSFPDQNEPGFLLDQYTFVSNHYGDHPALRGKAPAIPYTTGNPSADLRRQTADIVRNFVRPRPFIQKKVSAFFDEHMHDTEVIGVHVRGTDAVSARETRSYRQGSLDLERYVHALERLVRERPAAKILVATDSQASLDHLAKRFGQRVISYDAIRHEGGEVAGEGPTGCIMPAYVAADKKRAAQNGEDAVVEHLLLARCCHLVHNGASLATTVLLCEPAMLHTNTHAHA
jgi:hypothetical protein